MPSFPFRDADGRSWLAIPGLPADHPANGAAGAVPVAGVTFVADGGEVRVLPLSEFPRRDHEPRGEAVAPAPRHASRWLDFAGLLPYAHLWPPQPNR